MVISLLFGFLMSVLTWTFKRVLGQMENAVKEHKNLFAVHRTSIDEIQNQLIVIMKNFESTDFKIEELKEIAKETNENTKQLIRIDGDIRLMNKNLDEVIKLKKDVDNQYSFMRSIEKSADDKVEKMKEETSLLRRRDHFFANKLMLIKTRMEKQGTDFGDTDWNMPAE